MAVGCCNYIEQKALQSAALLLYIRFSDSTDQISDQFELLRRTIRKKRLNILRLGDHTLKLRLDDRIQRKVQNTYKLKQRLDRRLAASAFHVLNVCGRNTQLLCKLLL